MKNVIYPTEDNYNLRYLVLKPIEGKLTRDSKGLSDPRLWKGANRIVATMDPLSCLWETKYEVGAPPNEIRNTKFTKYGELLRYLRGYFYKRGFEVVETQDEPAISNA